MIIQAGRKGVEIDLTAVSKKLEPVIKNKALRDLYPETVQYAQKRAAILKKRESYTTMETQEAIQMLNQTLENFYRNPSPQMTGRAYVDAMIANHLRKGLDIGIAKTTGKQYQALKRKYGALRTLEKDVVKRAIVDARKNVKGLIDFSDVYTGYHIVKGLLAAEPSTLIAGGMAKGIARYLRLRNDPNRIVMKMFKDVDKLIGERGGI